MTGGLGSMYHGIRLTSHFFFACIDVRRTACFRPEVGRHWGFESVYITISFFLFLPHFYWSLVECPPHQ